MGSTRVARHAGASSAIALTIITTRIASTRVETSACCPPSSHARNSETGRNGKEDPEFDTDEPVLRTVPRQRAKNSHPRSAKR
jgi:hypothetical protein